MKRLLAFGAFVGVTLGLLSGGMDILIWTSMGRPAVLVRLGWQRIHITIGVLCGLPVGLVYGAFLGLMIDPKRLRKNAAFIVPGILLFATGVYAAGALLSIRVMNILPWLGGHAVVLIAMLGIARLGAGSLPARSD